MSVSECNFYTISYFYYIRTTLTGLANGITTHNYSELYVINHFVCPLLFKQTRFRAIERLQNSFQGEDEIAETAARGFIFSSLERIYKKA